jgi:hypothetical protein
MTIRVRIVEHPPVDEESSESYSYTGYDLDNNGKLDSREVDFKNKNAAVKAAKEKYGNDVEIIGG